MKCDDCLWNWQDLHGGQERICYNRESKFFHEPVPGKKCKQYSSQVVVGEDGGIYPRHGNLKKKGV